jgi:hypothetical protein
MQVTLKLGGLCAAAAIVASAAATPTFAGTFGSTSFLTERSCSSVTGADACDGSGPGQSVVASTTDGGIGVGSNATLSLADGSATGAVDFVTGLDLPVIHASSNATGDVRMNSNDMGWQSYTYTGAAPSPLSFTGTLTVDDSSTDGGDGGLPGGAKYFIYAAIWDPSILAGLSSPLDLFNGLFGRQCGTAGVLAAGAASAALPGGAQGYSVSTAGCGSDPFVINPGETVYAVVGLQIPSNRGGFVDATNTFGLGLNPNLGSTVIANLQRTLIPGVPEPSAWTMLLLGCGGAGGLLRRRRRAVMAG